MLLSQEAATGPHAGRATGAGRLLAAFRDFETFPALRTSRDAMIAALGEPAAGHGDLIVVVESDPALAIAVLRAGARAARERPPVDIPAALATLSLAEIEETAKRVSTFDFFDHSRTWSQTAEQFRIHARATQAAAEDLRRVLGLGPRPTLRVAALVHDIGKLVLLRGYARYEQLSTVRAAPGDRRVHERNELGVDHALAGGVLARRLGLPDSLARTIEHHHDEWALGDAALIRLADMLAHYSAGALVSSSELWCVAKAVGLSAKQLRSALDRLPGGGHMPAHPATPSPLTPRETEMIQKLSAGKLYKEIAAELGVQVTTVRSHLHNAYSKLGVQDRAQAVLLATSRGWL